MGRVPSSLLFAAMLSAWPRAAGGGASTQAGGVVTGAGTAPTFRADFNGDGAADLAIGVPGEAWVPARGRPGWSRCYMGRWEG
jgi:hypothetical protein